MGERSFSIEVRPERLHRARAAFAAIFFLQNRRFQESLDRWPILGRQQALRLVRVLAPIAAILAAWITVIEATCPTGEPVVYGILTLALVALSASLLFHGVDGWQQALERFTRSVCDWKARTVIARTVPRCPFTATYTIGDDELSIRVDELGIARAVSASRIAYAVRSGDVLCFFERPSARRWSALMYVSSPELERSITEFLRRHHIEPVPADGA